MESIDHNDQPLNARLSSRVDTVPRQKSNFGVDEGVEDFCHTFQLVYCISLSRRRDRWKNFCNQLQSRLGRRCQRFIDKVQRFDAVDGVAVMSEYEKDGWRDPDFPKLDWDATQNALYDSHIRPPMEKQMTAGEVGCAMSHKCLWRKLVEEPSDDMKSTMLVLEDDALFYTKNVRKGGGSRRVTFFDVLPAFWTILPKDWDILYLGFSRWK